MPWKSSGRPPREDRLFTEVEVSLPPKIAGLWFEPSRETIVALEEAAVAVASLDVSAGSRMAAISGFLLRSEAVSSSKIEHVDANRNDYARAMIGLKATDQARSMVAAAEAVQSMISDAGDTGEVRVEALLKAHKALMKDDPMDGHNAGSFRDVQNWIGGSDYSPRGAIHVPPPPALVPELMDDLMAFCARKDIPIVAQAAIAHAHFESIHPFTDGNGRIGRALIGSISRRRRLTKNTVTPIASAMVADVETYFSLLNNYRNGDVDPFVLYLAKSAMRASQAASESVAALDELPALWTDLLRPRKNSAEAKLIPWLLEQPVFEAHRAAYIAGVEETSIYKTLNRMTEAGVLSLVSQSQRNRAWAAMEVLDEVDRLNRRLAAKAV
ncbi:Fic family protein [Paenarthrobacter sp. TYUT067]|uniref:Fic family protein n=1 Tax=Paenarthrobacter sp. TYUT067 TaxID=2926245 RepID=UPI001FB67277|nr:MULTISPECIES: Fic family protein [unclassified Paenarthrobacter]MCM0615921.1 Fic family protein [Paenarthrobacter sp. TYUT067]